MSGRPINKDREMAIFMGEKTYVGSAHSKCGTTARYVSGGGCVHCARIIATEQREARKYLQTRAGAIDSRGDQGGGYPSSQDVLDSSPEMALEQLEADEIADAAIEDYDAAEARRQASIDELM